MNKEFLCEVCLFKTKYRKNFKRHLTTKLHRNLMSRAKNVTIKKTNRGGIKSILLGREKKYKCGFCGIEASKKSNLRRHQKKCLLKQIEEKDQKIQEITKERDEAIMNNDRNAVIKEESKKKIEHYEREIEFLYKTASDLKDDKNKISKIKYIHKNYKPETNLKELPYSEFKSKRRILYIDDPMTKNEGIIQDSIYSHEHNTLDSYIGDVVMEKYEGVDPEEREIWVTDAVRLKFIVRKKRNIYYTRGKKKDQIKKTEYYWFDDMNGEYTCEKIIEPTLTQIKYIIVDYQKRFNKTEYKKAKTLIERENFMRKNETMLSIIRSIDDGVLHKKILRYIAPKMALRK